MGGEGGVGGDADETCTIVYKPKFGDVPGYLEGETLGAVDLKGPNPKAQGPPEVVVSLVQEWEEWKVVNVVY